MGIILRFLKPYRGLCLCTLLLMLVDVAGALLIPTLTAEMINIGVSSRDMGLILEKGLVMLGVAVVSGLSTLASVRLCARLSARIGRDMRNALYDKSLLFSSHDFEQFGTGSMITRTLSDVTIVQQAFVMAVEMILPVPVMCVMGVVMAYAIDPFMGSLLIGATVIVIAAAIVITRRAATIFEALQRCLDRINVVVRENITGVRVIRAFNKEPSEERRMRRSFENYAENAIRANRLFFALESLALFVINVCVVGILWVGGNRVGAHIMEIGDISAITQYAMLILFYVIMAQMVFVLLPRAKVCLDRIGAVLNRTPEITDGPAAPSSESRSLQTPEAADGDMGPARQGGADEDTESTRGKGASFSFRDVSFRFADADEATLDDLSFTLPRGQTTAIIGSTGSGKSTIAKLLLRFHDASRGAVLYGDRDIRRMTQHDLRSRISYVPQKAWLFSGTIADNLRYGNEEADEGELTRALDIAQAGFVEKLPQGLASPVSQGGTNFSGGQRQRLSIARALVKRADLYIFDDSFSALDFKTDAALRRALAREVGDSVVLIIAQRISSIANADQIIVLDNGRIAGRGTHEQLISSCPVYRDIAKSQTKGGVIDDEQPR